MKLLQPNAASICNSEVLQVLAERGADGSGKALTVERMAYQYLSTQPVHPLNAKQLKDFFSVLQPLNLSRGELLQLANLGPTTAVEVHLIVPDCEFRLGDEGVATVLAAVAARVARPDNAGGGSAKGQSADAFVDGMEQ